jgi:ATP-dependent DNA helicase RecG
MPLPVNIPDLIHGRTVEWERLEFKQGWNPLDTLHTICAFANDFHNLGGGYIIIGVKESNGRPVLPPSGLDPDAFDAIQKQLLQLGSNAIQPAYHPITIPCQVEGRDVLIIWVPGGQTRPYKAKLGLGKTNKEYGYFIRKGSSTVRAKGPDETELLSLAATVPFDDRINQQAKVQDLSRTLIIDFLQ